MRHEEFPLTLGASSIPPDLTMRDPSATAPLLTLLLAAACATGEAPRLAIADVGAEPGVAEQTSRRPNPKSEPAAFAAYTKKLRAMADGAPTPELRYRFLIEAGNESLVLAHVSKGREPAVFAREAFTVAAREREAQGERCDRARLLVGAAEAQLGNDETAEDRWLELAQACPGSPLAGDADLAIGRTARARGDSARARAAMGRASKIAGRTRLFALSQLAMFEIDQDRYADALEHALTLAQELPGAKGLDEQETTLLGMNAEACARRAFVALKMPQNAWEVMARAWGPDPSEMMLKLADDMRRSLREGDAVVVLHGVLARHPAPPIELAARAFLVSLLEATRPSRRAEAIQELEPLATVVARVPADGTDAGSVGGHLRSLATVATGLPASGVDGAHARQQARERLADVLERWKHEAAQRPDPALADGVTTLGAIVERLR